MWLRKNFTQLSNLEQLGRGQPGRFFGPQTVVWIVIVGQGTSYAHRIVDVA